MLKKDDENKRLKKEMLQKEREFILRCVRWKKGERFFKNNLCWISGVIEELEEVIDKKHNRSFITLK